MRATAWAARTSNAGMRRSILALARSKRAGRFVSRYGMRLGGARFVAGEDLDAALDVLAAINEKGMYANTTLLGEDVSTRDEAEQVVVAYEGVLDRIAERGLKVNVALKLTHLGLLLDEELAFANVARLVDRAASHGSFIRIDMESSGFVDVTLRTYRRLRESGRDAVGAVLQAYLYRSEKDLEELLPLQPNLRLVKGAYLEPASVARPEKADVDAAYLKLIEQAMRGGAYTAVATHDENAIEHVVRFMRGQRHRSRPLRVPDAVRRPPAAAGAARRPGLQGARRDAVRTRVVPVPDAAHGRAAGEPPVRGAQPGAPLST